MRIRALTLALAAALVLAAPAAAPAQVEQYVPPDLPVRSSGDDPAYQSAPAPPVRAAEQPPAPVQAVPAQEPTETTPAPDTETAPEPQPKPEVPDGPDVPGEYCDPLSGACGNDPPGGPTQEPSAVAPAESATVGTSTGVVGGLALTGAPIGLGALLGAALVGAGAALRRRSRDPGD